MKNKIASKYEKKMWYRVMKSIYISLFVIFFSVYNLVIFSEYSEDRTSMFIIGNLIIIFAMGTMEGLFWYIVNGKWGYPKDLKSEEDNKVL